MNFRSERGQTLVEYALMAAGLAVILVFVSGHLGPLMTGIWNAASSGLGDGGH